MATALLDTTILVDYTRGRPSAFGVIGAEMLHGVPMISVVSSMELVVGCRDKTEVHRVNETLKHFAVIPITPSISRLALDWLSQFSKSHGLLIPDALIAATAYEEGLPLLTLNERHFSMLPGCRSCGLTNL